MNSERLRLEDTTLSSSLKLNQPCLDVTSLKSRPILNANRRILNVTTMIHILIGFPVYKHEKLAILKVCH